MKSSLLVTHYSLLIAAGLIALARWFHPALFSVNIVILLLAITIGLAIIHLWNYD